MSGTSLNTDQIGSLLYLTALLVGVGGYLLLSLSRRQAAGQTVRQGLIWLSIFIALIAGYGLWQDVGDQLLPRQTVFADGGGVAVPRGPDGHYHMTLQVNGVPVSFVVDTGATDIVLSGQDAARVGLHPEELAFTGQARTANGVVSTARVRLDRVELGPVTDLGVPAVVNGGALDVSLLGMRYLERWDSVSIEGDRMVLRR